jgi:hypothetical protein
VPESPHNLDCIMRRTMGCARSGLPSWSLALLVCFDRGFQSECSDVTGRWTRCCTLAAQPHGCLRLKEGHVIARTMRRAHCGQGSPRAGVTLPQVLGVPSASARQPTRWQRVQFGCCSPLISVRDQSCRHRRRIADAESALVTLRPPQVET